MFGLFDIIAVVVFIVILVKHSGRISNLEKLIQGSGQPTQSQNAQSQTATQKLVPGMASQQYTKPVPATNSGPVVNKKNEESSGRLLGKIGIVAVLLGVAFFLKYAFDSQWIGEAGRVMIGVLFGLGFMGTGQYLRKNYVKYSDLLIGGGSAILYLSVFSAYSFYHLIDGTTAGVFMFLVTALTFAISIVNATITLSLVGIIGAFATPFLVGSGNDDMVVLFTYMIIINLGVLGISFFKKWPQLNLASFLGTIILFGSWFGRYYDEDLLIPVMVFCFVTFLIFIVAQVARSISAGIKAKEFDYMLLGGNALAFALIGYIILQPYHHDILGFAAVFVALVYIVIAFAVNKFNATDTALNIFLPGLAVTFLSLAVPLQFSGPWIAVAWLIESCVLYFIASTISNRGFQVMGVVVYVLGLVDFFQWYTLRNFDLIGGSSRNIDFVPIFNSAFAVLLLAIVVAYAIVYFYKKFGSTSVEIQKRGIMVFVVIANILTIYALSIQITEYHSAKIEAMHRDYNAKMTDAERYSNGYSTSAQTTIVSDQYYADISSTKNQSNTLVSILWTLYAALLTGIGFAQRIASVRRLGLILFIITAIKVLIDVWSLGQLYRIISFIAFGLIALGASFAYTKFKDRLKDIV